MGRTAARRSMPGAGARSRGGPPGPRRAGARPGVRLHFDDGNASDLTTVLPALLARGLAATFFLPVGLLGRPGFLELQHASELADAGMTIGSHGLHHRPWPTLSPDELDDEI